jgi:molybdopterin-guanine dinucleotide biosynthesis protein
VAVVVVGGNSRNIGKTSVVAGLIRSLVEMEWSAFKVTQHGHLLCDGSSKRCDCTNAAHTVAFTEETNRTSGKDSARYLVAGAVRSFLLRTRQGSLAEAMPRLRAECAASRNAIIESNSVMEFLHPHLYLVVLDLATADFKTSAKLYLERADAIVLRDSGTVRRKGAASFDVEGLIESKPKFAVESPELVAFVRERLAETMCHPSQWRAART